MGGKKQVEILTYTIYKVFMIYVVTLLSLHGKNVTIFKQGMKGQYTTSRLE